MTRNRDAVRNARFECLERKQLLAGDVLIGVIDGALSMQGDSNDNAITISAGVEAGSYLVAGLNGTNLLPDPSTGLPGDPVSEVVVTDVAGAKVELGDGADVIAVFEASFRGKVAIDTGTGDDQVHIGAAGDVGAELGDSLLDDASVNVRGKLSISTGIGNDEVIVGDAAIRGRLRIDTDVGDDLVSLGGSAGVGVEAALPDTELPPAVLNVHGGIGVKLGEGNDQLDLAQVGVKGGATVDAGLGDDTIGVQLAHAGHLKINAGDGNDGVQITDSVFALLGVKLGDGADILATAGIDARFGLMAGGLGEDTLNMLGENNFLHELVRGFELPLVDELVDGLVDDLPLIDRLGRLPLADHLDDLPDVDQVVDRLNDVVEHVTSDVLPRLDTLPELPSLRLSGRISADLHASAGLL